MKNTISSNSPGTPHRTIRSMPKSSQGTASEGFRRFLRDFLLCGLTGWCMEICFTALISMRRRNMQLTGQTSLWMFPIYGCAALLAPIGRLLKGKPFWLRGLLYMGLIFTAEFVSGSLLSRRRLCPWNYGHSRWHIRRIIRLDYAPFWFLGGLFFERILGRKAL